MGIPLPWARVQRVDEFWAFVEMAVSSWYFFQSLVWTFKLYVRHTLMWPLMSSPMCNSHSNPSAVISCGVLLLNGIWQRWWDVAPMIVLCDIRLCLSWLESLLWPSRSKQPRYRELWMTSGSWMWPSANSQWKAEALSHFVARKWILSTIQVNWEADSSLNKPPGENTAQLTPDRSLMRNRVVPRILMYRNYEVINGCCFKLVRLWSFLMQWQKTNTTSTNSPINRNIRPHTFDYLPPHPLSHPHFFLLNYQPGRSLI